MTQAEFLRLARSLRCACVSTRPNRCHHRARANWRRFLTIVNRLAATSARRLFAKQSHAYIEERLQDLHTDRIVPQIHNYLPFGGNECEPGFQQLGCDCTERSHSELPCSSSYSSRIWTIATWYWIDFIRKERRLSEGGQYDHVPYNASCHQRFEGQHEWMRNHSIRSAAKRLSDDDYRLLIGIFFEGKSLEEIGNDEEISYRAIRRRLRQLRLRFGKKLKQEGVYLD